MAVNPFRTDGIDVSRYQGTIDWPKVPSGIFWTACKATQGTTWVDPSFKANRAGMKASGRRHRLFYHWLNPAGPVARLTSVGRKADARKQAAFFIATVGALAPGEGIMLDAEQDGITADQVLEWCLVVEAHYRRPVAVYTGVYVAGGTIWRSEAIFNGQRLRHLAAYVGRDQEGNYTQTADDFLAKTSRRAAPYRWDALQWTSRNTIPPVPGVPSTNGLDINQIDNVAGFDRVCGVQHQVPAPPPFDPAKGVYGTWPAKKNKRHLWPAYKGDDVKYMQALVGARISGTFDRQTVVKVQNFQRFFKIKEFGVGPKTWGMIDFLATAKKS